MKFSLASLFLSSTIVGSTAALRCGIKGVTKPCIGDTDQRYDVDKGYDLVDQDPFWGRYGGLYVAEDFHYDSDGNPFTSRVIPDLEAVGGYSMFPVRRFTNVTVDGSRHSLNSYFFLQNNAGVAPGFVSMTLHSKTVSQTIILFSSYSYYSPVVSSSHLE